MSKNKTHKKNAASPARPGVANCPSCGVSATPDAAYCQSCGAALGGASTSRRRDPVAIALYAVLALGVAVALTGIVYSVVKENAMAVRPTASGGPVGGPQDVDISSMTPREAADRLFNRVMMAEEQGNLEEARRFAPMALQAYQRVRDLDADAHYHLGLINIAAGDYDAAREQVDVLRQYAPTHLLAILLEYDIAEGTGDTAGAAAAVTAFKQAYDSEIAMARPEYKAHRNSIEAFRKAHAGS